MLSLLLLLFLLLDDDDELVVLGAVLLSVSLVEWNSMICDFGFSRTSFSELLSLKILI
jgi:hypothetical protein